MNFFEWFAVLTYYCTLVMQQLYRSIEKETDEVIPTTSQHSKAYHVSYAANHQTVH